MEFLLGDNADENILSCISQTIYPNLDIILSNNISGDIQLKIQQRPDRAVLLKTKLKHPLITKRYDFVLIDTQGAVGALQDAAAFAAYLLVSPVMPETLSAREFLSGTYEMLERLSFGEAIGLTVPPLLALIYAQNRTRDSREITDEIQRLFNQSLDGKKRLLNTIIPRAKAYTEAISLRLPVHCHDRVQTNKSDCAFGVMHNLVYEIYPPIKECGLKASSFHDLADLLNEDTVRVGNMENEWQPENEVSALSQSISQTENTSHVEPIGEIAQSETTAVQNSKNLFEEPDLFVCIADILAGHSCEHNIPFGFVDYSALTYPLCFFDAGHTHQQISDAIRLIVRVKFPNATDGEIQMLLDEMADRSIPSPFEYFAVLCEEKGEDL